MGYIDVCVRIRVGYLGLRFRLGSKYWFVMVLGLGLGLGCRKRAVVPVVSVRVTVKNGYG